MHFPPAADGPQHSPALFDDPLCGSAPEAARAWLLIEHPGPWPAFGPPPDLARELAEYSDRALRDGVRTQLVRRTDRRGRAGSASAPRTGKPGMDSWGDSGETGELDDPDSLARDLPPPYAPARHGRILIGGGAAGSRWLVRLATTALDDLLRIDPAAFHEPSPPLPGSKERAALLVCTHGRREVCCAQFGRPVARALAAEFGPLVWETTHVGGDEFAANLVVLPSGAYFGRLLPSVAVDLARRALAGDLDPQHYRGTAGQPAPVQAADCLLRRTLLHEPLWEHRSQNAAAC